MNISNQRVTAHPFLDALYRDGWYPDRAVDRGKEILLRLCERIEADRPADLAALFARTYGFEDVDVEELIGTRDW